MAIFTRRLLSLRDHATFWTNCISRTLSFIQPRSLKKLLVGHRRSVTLQVLGDVILLEAALRLAYLRAAVSERKTCEITRVMREVVEPNCMRNGVLEAYNRPNPTSLQTLARFIATRGRYMCAPIKKMRIIIITQLAFAGTRGRHSVDTAVRGQTLQTTKGSINTVTR